MKIEKEWRASSRVDRVGEREELVNMAGRWGVSVDVYITKPYTYSQGPLEKIVINEEMRKRETAPSSSASSEVLCYAPLLKFPFRKIAIV